MIIYLLYFQLTNVTHMYSNLFLILVSYVWDSLTQKQIKLLNAWDVFQSQSLLCYNKLGISCTANPANSNRLTCIPKDFILHTCKPNFCFVFCIVKPEYILLWFVRDTVQFKVFAVTAKLDIEEHQQNGDKKIPRKTQLWHMKTTKQRYYHTSTGLH